MKIFYAVQATGNGHISRAMELLPHLQKFGTVDIFLSGDNSHLALDAPVIFRSKGISLFYNCTGGLDYWQIMKNLHPMRVKQEIRDLPVEKYDLVLNDFEYITAAACAKKDIPSIHFGHQASFQSSHTPRPEKKSLAGEWLLKHYAKATHYAGLHFKQYDDFIFPAIVKKEILQAEPKDLGHITVYLPSWCDKQLADILSPFRSFRFQVFSRETSTIRTEDNIRFMPVNKQLFDQSMISCTGIICGAGFETPAEAMHLGKKILAIPIRGQYEQQCNAAALCRLGITCLPKIDEQFAKHVEAWLNISNPLRMDYSGSVSCSLEYILTLAETAHKMKAA